MENSIQLPDRRTYGNDGYLDGHGLWLVIITRHLNNLRGRYTNRQNQLRYPNRTQERPSPNKSLMQIAYSSLISAKFSTAALVLNTATKETRVRLPHIFVSFGVFFGFPCFDHDAFTHQALHTLDAPDLIHNDERVVLQNKALFSKRFATPIFNRCTYLDSANERDLSSLLFN